MFCLQNHPKYAPIYLNLPSGNNWKSSIRRAHPIGPCGFLCSADYTRVKRVFGPEQVEAAVEADRQREQAEKARKQTRRSVDRGGR